MGPFRSGDIGCFIPLIFEIEKLRAAQTYFITQLLSENYLSYTDLFSLNYIKFYGFTIPNTSQVLFRIVLDDGSLEKKKTSINIKTELSSEVSIFSVFNDL